MQSLIQTVLTMSTRGAVVAAAIVLLRLILKKAPKRYACMLWVIVLLRLLIPSFPQAQMSILPEREWTTVSLETEQLQEEYPQIPNLSDEIQTADPAVPVQKSAGDDVEMPKTAVVDGWTVAGWVWLAGVAVMAGYGLVSLFPLKRRLMASVPVGDRVYLADHIESPFVLGVLRPRIYLPSDLWETPIEPILLHERQHIRWGDPLVKAVYYLALCLHWFNPMAWIAFILVGRDMEMSCDEAVLGKLAGEVRREYAATLLNFSTDRRRIVPMPLAFGEGDTKRRIKNVLNYKKPRIWVSILAVMVCIVAAGCMLTDPKDEAATHMQETLHHPQAAWNSSYDTFVETMELTEVDPAKITDGHLGEGSTEEPFAVRYDNISMLGQTAEYVMVRFGEESEAPDPLSSVKTTLGYSHKSGLDLIMVVFPDDADMAAVKEELTDLYGEPADSYEFISESMQKCILSSDEHCTYWVSTKTLKDYLDEQGLEYLDNEATQMYIDQPMAFICWSDDYGDDRCLIWEDSANGVKQKNILYFWSLI